MSLNIPPRMPTNFEPNFPNSEGANAMSVILELNKKKVKIRRSKIRDMISGFAEIAYDIGETNDPEKYAEEMADAIFGAYNKVSKKQKRN